MAIKNDEGGKIRLTDIYCFLFVDGNKHFK